MKYAKPRIVLVIASPLNLCEEQVRGMPRPAFGRIRDPFERPDVGGNVVALMLGDGANECGERGEPRAAAGTSYPAPPSRLPALPASGSASPDDGHVDREGPRPFTQFSSIRLNTLSSSGITTRVQRNSGDSCCNTVDDRRDLVGENLVDAVEIALQRSQRVRAQRAARHPQVELMWALNAISKCCKMIA